MSEIQNQSTSGPEQSLHVQRTARYATLGKANPDTREVWVVMHGYGQLVRYFIRHFRPLDDGSRFILAPEGLSRYYLGDGVFERVGASWMTKEDRLEEIEDQRRYLNQVLSHTTSDINWANTKLVLLGFSQGAATAWRWLLRGDLPVSPTAIAIWAGMPPQDLEGIDRHPDLRIFAAWGDADPFVTPERAQLLTQLLEASGRPVTTFPFVGKHTLDGDTLLKMADDIASLST